MERSLFKSVCFCAAGVWPVGGNQQWEYSGNDPQSGCGADPQRGKSHPPRPSEGKRIRARLRWAVTPVRSDSPVWLPLSLALSSFLSHSAVGLLWWFLTTKLCQSLVLTHTTKAAREKPGSEFKNLISKAASHQNPLVCADILHSDRKWRWAVHLQQDLQQHYSLTSLYQESECKAQEFTQTLIENCWNAHTVHHCGAAAGCATVYSLWRVT